MLNWYWQLVASVSESDGGRQLSFFLERPGSRNISTESYGKSLTRGLYSALLVPVAPILRRSRLSRGQHVSNAACGAEQDERDDEAPCDLKGAASKR
jgi:hypothetical protein